MAPPPSARRQQEHVRIIQQVPPGLTADGSVEYFACAPVTELQRGRVSTWATMDYRASALGGCAASAMEGFAGPLNETAAADIADACLAISGADATFSYRARCDLVAGCRSSGR
eukprot:2178248-Pyramimonas_sp.AAC.1